MRSQRLIALFGLGVVLFTYPLLSLFARDVLVLGVPLLYGYLFCVWAAFIGLAAWIVEGRGRLRLPPDREEREP
jgi:hypothetical protein